MELELKRPRLTARLPVAACSPEFFAQIKSFAEANEVSVSEVIRASLQFFLAAHVGKSEITFGKSDKKKAGKRKKSAS